MPADDKPDRLDEATRLLPPMRHGECECRCHDAVEFSHPGPNGQRSKACCGKGAGCRCEGCGGRFPAPADNAIGACPKCGYEDTFLCDDGSYENIGREGRNKAAVSGWRGGGEDVW